MGGAVKRFTFTVEPYDYEVALWVGGPTRAVNEAFEEAAVSVRADALDEGIVTDEGGAFVIWIRRTKPNVIAHECVHLAWRVLRHAQVPITYGNEEVFASHVGKMVEQVTKLARGRKVAP
jgi:hypothetical protein